MKVIGKYGNAVINGTGCGGVQPVDVNTVFLNGGVSASSAGKLQSTFTGEFWTCNPRCPPSPTARAMGLLACVFRRFGPGFWSLVPDRASVPASFQTARKQSIWIGTGTREVFSF